MKIPKFNRKDSKEKLINSEKEVCVLCGKITDIHISMPIEERKYYVLGVGQLCRECHKELTHEKIWVDL